MHIRRYTPHSLFPTLLCSIALFALTLPSAAERHRVDRFYYQALNRWAADQPAVQEVAERRLMKATLGPRGRGPELVWSTCQRVAAGSPRVTLALVEFELAIYRRLLRGKPLKFGFDRVAETRLYLEELGALLLRQMRTVEPADLDPDQARQLLALAWTRAALDARSAERFSDFEDWLNKAVMLDPKLLSARLSLAALVEKRGNYRLARLHLNEALAGHPEDAESLLRRALIEIRLGKRQQAVASLETLTVNGYPSWIRSVAYQEWARLLAQQAQVTAAIDLLRRARKLFADDPSLSVELLYLLDDRSAESTALLDTLLVPQGGSMSGRVRYNLWPAILELQDAAVGRRLATFRPALGPALEAIGGMDRVEPPESPLEGR